MGAWAARLLVVAAVLVLAFVDPLASGERQRDTASIRSYDAEMELTEDGELFIDEQIVVRMPSGKRGIFRIFDTTDPRRAGIDHPVHDVRVERNEQTEPYTWVDSAAGTETLRIGSESVFLPEGEHEYRIRSSTTDVLEPGDEGETLWWWDVIGAGWQMAMGSTRVQVELPVEPRRADCVMGEDTPCTATVEGRTLTVVTGPLDPFTPVTVKVAFPAGALPAPPAGDSSTATILLSVIAGLLAGGLALVLFRATRERRPGFPVLFEPPAGVGPALGVRVLHESNSPDDLQATLYTLAERGILRLEGDDDQWRVELLVEPSTAHMDPGESAVLVALGLWGPGTVFTLSRSKDAGQRLSEARQALRSHVQSSGRAYLDQSAPGIIVKLLAAIAPLIVLAVAGLHLFGASGWKPWPLIVGAATFSLLTLGMLLDPGVATKRTALGRDLWSRVGGFERFLTTDSAESRFEAAKHLDWYPRYLPWALAFGSADAWARRFESQGVALPPVPWIVWSGHGAFSATRMGDSFHSAMTSAAAAYAASQASSGGGGGFSGGSGGGGGGGGSW